jgi:hypothetical protein
METIVTIVIVLVVALWVGWSFYRTVTGKTGYGCSGGNCKSKNCAELIENSDKK